MKKLLLDIGNSRCKVAFAEGTVIENLYNCDNEKVVEFVQNALEREEIKEAVVSSVRERNLELIDFLQNNCNRVIEVSGIIPLPVNILYKTPQTLGADRIASVVAAHKLFPDKDCMVFDFGTAITVDFVGKDGDYKGGNISLGLNTRIQAINHYTSKLPLVNKDEEITCIGRTTESAVRNGIILGIMFEVEGYIRNYPHYNVVFTGGDSKFFAEKMNTPVFLVNNLVIFGLAQIAEFHATE